MFLSREEILANKASLFPSPAQFDARHVHEVSYDLRVGDEVLLSEDRIPIRLGPDSPYSVLPPGQFALIKTHEEISIPKHLIGLISIRSSFKFQGLINISGFHVDPTYRGHLIFSVQNVGPNDIRLKYLEPVFMIMFAELKTPYSGDPREPGYYKIPLNLMAQLGGPSLTLTKLKNDLDQLSLTIKIYGGIAVGLFIAIIAWMLRGKL